MKGKFLLWAQIFLLLALFYLGNLTKVFTYPPAAIIFAVGLLLAIWSFYNLGLDTYTPFPEPKRESKHIQTGAYTFARHPMYTGIMMLGLALLLANPNFLSTIIYLLLLYVLDAKASVEEVHLQKMHPSYKAYKEKTKKFIPCIY